MPITPRLRPATAVLLCLAAGAGTAWSGTAHAADSGAPKTRTAIVVEDPSGDVNEVGFKDDPGVPASTVDISRVKYVANTTKGTLQVRYDVKDVRPRYQRFETYGKVTTKKGNKIRMVLTGNSGGAFFVSVGRVRRSCADDSDQSVSLTKEYVVQRVPLSCLPDGKASLQSRAAVERKTRNVAVREDVTDFIDKFRL